jgi:hypothetical protein
MRHSLVLTRALPMEVALGVPKAITQIPAVRRRVSALQSTRRTRRMQPTIPRIVRLGPVLAPQRGARSDIRRLLTAHPATVLMAQPAIARTVHTATVPTARRRTTAIAAIPRRAVTAQRLAVILPRRAPIPHRAAPVAVALTPAPAALTAEVEAVVVLTAEVAAVTAVGTTN